MAKRPKAAGGMHAVVYTLKMGKKSGSYRNFYKVLKSKNVCKTCALGMKGMKNELGEGFQVCKKSMQAVAQDLLGGIGSEFFSKNSLQDLSNFSGRDLESAGRIIEPMIANEGDTHFSRIDWRDAYDILTNQIKNVGPNRMFFYTSGRSSNEAAFLVQILGRQRGTNNINNCSYYCHQASGVGLKQSIGSGTATVNLEDVEKSDLVIVVGANPASNHPRFVTHLIDVRKRGGKVIIVNPFREVGLERFVVPSRPSSLLLGVNSKVSDLYLQPHSGGDMAFFKAVAVRLYQNKDYNEEFLKNNTNGWDDLQNDLETEDFDELLVKAGIPPKEFDKFYEILTNHENVIFSWAMGITHQKWGTQTVRVIANIQLMLGNIGREGAGLLPLRGHSNVQGVGSVGVVPKLTPDIVDGLAKHLNIEVRKTPGLDTFSSMEAAHGGQIDFAMMLGGNIYEANPDLNWAKEALSKINWTIYISTTLNRGHIHGRGKNTLIIPVRVRDEDKQATTQESMFSYVRISEGGFEGPNPALPTEVELFTHVGNRIYGNVDVPWLDFANHSVIREFISKTIPYLKPLRHIKIDSGEFTIPGRIKHEPKFTTENEKANLFIGEAPDARADKDHYNLITFRSEGQFNTIVYDKGDVYRGVDHRLVVFMNKKDIDDSDFNSGDWVWIQSSVGKIKVEVVDAPIRSRNVAMFYPEGNMIVPAKVDPQSMTPTFKRIKVSIKNINQEIDST